MSNPEKKRTCIIPRELSNRLISAAALSGVSSDSLATRLITEGLTRLEQERAASEAAKPVMYIDVDPPKEIANAPLPVLLDKLHMCELDGVDRMNLQRAGVATAIRNIASNR